MFDAEAFLKERGFVTDKHEAIELLCETNRAWDVLDASLQKDPDVIMFYQPSGYKITQEEENVGPTVTTTRSFTDYKFHKPVVGELKGREQYDYGVVVPLIDFPVGFDFDKYFEIQRELKESATKAPEGYEVEWWYYSYETSVSQDDWGHDPGETGVFLYDREVLKRHASEILGTRRQ